MSTKPVIVPIIVDDKTGQAFVQLNEKLLQMKSRASETMNSMRGDTEKARAGIALLADDLGVKIPRHLQALVAESELAGAALKAAFAGIALVAFLDVAERIPAAIQKMSDELMGFTAEVKKAAAAEAELNKTFIEGQKQIEQIQAQNNLIGLTGSAMYKQKIKDETDALAKKTAELQAQSGLLLTLQRQSQEKETVTTTNGPYGGSTTISAPTAAAEQAKQQIEAMGGLEKLKKSVADMTEENRQLQLTIDGDQKSLKAAFGDEAIERNNKLIQSLKELTAIHESLSKMSGDSLQEIAAQYDALSQKVLDNINLQGGYYKNLDLDLFKKIQQQKTQAMQEELDKRSAALIKAAQGDGKILASVLSVPTTQVITIQNVADTIQRALQAEKALEESVAAASKAAGDSQLQTEQKLAPLRQKAAKDLQDEVDYYKSLATASKDPSLVENAKKFESELDTMRAKAQTLADVMKTQIKTQFEGAFTDMILQTKSVSQAFKEMAASIISDLVKMILEMYVFKAVSGLIGGFFGGSSGNGVVAALPGGGTSVGAIDMSGLTPHASGGPVSPGMAYLVGENGPEPFIPSSAGTILPNDFMKRGNVYNIDARNAQPGVERDIMRAIKASENNAVVRSVRAIDSRAKRRG